MTDEKSPEPDLVSDNRLDVIDPHQVPTLYADWIVEAGVHLGIVNIALGCVDYAIRGANGKPRIVVITRLRLPLAVAENAGQMIADIIKKAAEQSAEPKPPNPTLN
jgi:hypothetical protein